MKIGLVTDTLLKSLHSVPTRTFHSHCPICFKGGLRNQYAHTHTRVMLFSFREFHENRLKEGRIFLLRLNDATFNL